MNLRGEVRESVSLDEDDLSDIEDEVFIRDGRHGYKFEDVSVKKPLMAPRRKVTKSNISTRLRNKRPCKAFCKPCCYAFIALTTLLGLIALVTILVSLFPLPIDKMKNWIISRSPPKEPQKKNVQCTNLEVFEVWKVNFPKLISETAVRVVDVDQDGVDDIIFGFSAGVDDNGIPPDIFCPMFLNTSSPCRGGVMALNGTSGRVLWKHWLAGAVFDLICSTDFDGDSIVDCVITGKGGIFRTISSRDGSVIWSFIDDDEVPVQSKINVFLPCVIPDQDNDNVSEVVATHSVEKDRITGHIVIVSGKNGTLLQKFSTPKEAVTYSKPQLLEIDGNYSILFGVGSLTSGGSLYIMSLYDLLLGNVSGAQTLYRDDHKGILSPSVLVDITGDGYKDIVSAFFNSNVIALDGKTFEILWNYTIPNSETLSVPIPGYFNNDNVTDFLVKYQTGSGFPVYYYSQAFILDGKTGKPVYSQPVIDSVGSQMGGLTIESDSYGFDWFLYWTIDCFDHEGSQDAFQFVKEPGNVDEDVQIKEQSQADMCRLRFNSSTIASLFALSQFDQPPGFKIYDSQNDTSQFYDFLEPIEEARQYFRRNEGFRNPPLIKEKSFGTKKKYKDRSNFRHKSNSQAVPASKKVHRKNEKLTQGSKKQKEQQPDFVSDYEQPSEEWLPYPQNGLNDETDPDYGPYIDESESRNIFDENKKLLNTMRITNNRDPRSKTNGEKDKEKDEYEGGTQLPDDVKGKREKHGKLLKKNLSEQKDGIYGYENIKNSQQRLMSDLNTLPNKILHDTYLKKQERKKSRFEERDLQPHENKRVEKNTNLVGDEKNNTNRSFTLWDLESENEMKERQGGELWRGKRDVKRENLKVPRVTTVGALVKPLDKESDGMDLVLVTYWVQSVAEINILLERDMKCIDKKLKDAIDSKERQYSHSKLPLESVIVRRCLKERGIIMKKQNQADFSNSSEEIPYFNEISRLNFGVLSVHRLRIQCTCGPLRKDETCVRFLKAEDQSWGSYLGRSGDGIFKTK